MGPECPSAEKPSGTEEDGKPCPDKLVAVVAVVAVSTEGYGTPCLSRSIACQPEPPILGPGYPTVEEPLGTEEDGKPCPDKLVDGTPLVVPDPPSVAVVSGSTEGGAEENGRPCPNKLVGGPPVLGPVPPSVAVVVGNTEGDDTPRPDKLFDCTAKPPNPQNSKILSNPWTFCSLHYGTKPRMTLISNNIKNIVQYQ